MRIVTWNCAGQFTTKWQTFLDLDADLAIIQECDPRTAAFAHEQGWSALRVGASSKGLALLAKPGWILNEIPAENEYSLIAKVQASVEFTLLAFWALPPIITGVSYLAQGEAIARHVAALEGPLVVAGDFNTTTEPRHIRTFNAIEAHGLVSAYHSSRGITRGGEAEPTYFHQWRQAQGFHLDLMFIPREWSITDVTLGTYEDYPAKRISDHVPLIAEVSERSSARSWPTKIQGEVV